MSVFLLWLAIVLLLGDTPKEFIRLFAGHIDTVHSHFEKDGLVIESERHHCSFLSYALPLFTNDSYAITSNISNRYSLIIVHYMLT